MLSRAAVRSLVRRVLPSRRIETSATAEDRSVALLKSSPLFNAAWYLAEYPDVAAAGLDPYRHFLHDGVTEGRNPGPDFDTNYYVRTHRDVARTGTNPLLHYIEFGAAEGRPIKPDSLSRKRHVTVADIVANKYAALQPLPGYAVPGLVEHRLTMVTDSVSRGSLYGGTATALILSALFAQRLGRSLRIVTRTEPPDEAAVGRTLRLNGVEWSGKTEFAFASIENESRDAIDLAETDLFLTTSWWTTAATLRTVGPARVVYLLQEDERMFYPSGDDQVRSQLIVARDDIPFVINARLLFDHLVGSGLDNIARNGMWFEPAFPAENYFYDPGARRTDGRKTLFFYARPFNHRNLFYSGLEAIEAALAQRVIDPAEWEICLVGRDLQPTTLHGGVEARIVENLDWAEYAALIRSVDLGLSLMNTPHPSYPPLDLAASGAVVVTNRYGAKQSLDQYSRNIICADLDRQSLVDAIGAGVALARDVPRREENFAASTFARDWGATFAPVLDRLAARFGSH